MRVLVLGVAIAFAAGLAAQPAEHDDVRKAEAERSAAVRAGDVAVLDRLLAPDYTEVDVDGRMRPRTQGLSVTPDASQSDKTIVHTYTDSAVVVCREGESRILRVWVRQTERWRLVAQHAVRIQPGAPPMKPKPEVLALPRVQRTNDEGPIVREVLAAQTALDHANSVGDAKAFESLTASDFIQITNHGMVRAKQDRVTEERLRQLSDRLNDEGPRPIAPRDDVHVRVYGDVAILSARTWPTAPDGTAGVPGRFTRLWRKAADGWQQVATISTMVTAP